MGATIVTIHRKVSEVNATNAQKSSHQSRELSFRCHNRKPVVINAIECDTISIAVDESLSVSHAQYITDVRPDLQHQQRVVVHTFSTYDFVGGEFGA